MNFDRFDTSIDIIHGDIKPQNILIFQDSDGVYTARMTDFGYSTRYAGDNDLMSIPISTPWNAPEHTRLQKMWTPFEAKKLDLFSFGLLCLWILFEKDISELTPPSQVARAMGGDGNSWSLPVQSVMILENSKADRNLSLLAQQLLEAEETLREDERGALKVFFTSILSEDQDRREVSAGNLFKRCVLSSQIEIQS